MRNDTKPENYSLTGVRYASYRWSGFWNEKFDRILKEKVDPKILKEIVISSAKLPFLLQSFPVERIKYIGLKLICRGEIKLILDWD